MHSDAYTRGFMEKLAELKKSAKKSTYAKEIDEHMKKRDERLGVKKPKPYVQPHSFKDGLKYILGRTGDYAGSLGRGLASAGGVTALRAGQGLFNLATWVPELADSLILGKLLGVDEGRGALGRAFGNFNRSIDKKVHGLRRWSGDYDYANRINGSLNRLMNGASADVLGGFLGWGGPAAFLGKGLVSRIGGAIGGGLGGGMALLDGREKQLRDRESWLHTLHPRDRVRVDPTSTAINQELAPTLAEYRRYHMPSVGIPTSPVGYIRVPYKWWHTGSDAPTKFREFGT